MKIIFTLFFIFTFVAQPSIAKTSQIEQHGDHDDGHKDADEHGHDDADEKGHAHADQGPHEEEVNSSVGPDKGITVFSETDGFKLSVEAIKNFELRNQRLVGLGPWSIPSAAVLYSGEEVNIYRVRNGFYKRIDFTLISKNGKDVKINSPDLKADDEVVIHGVAFLRSAEIVATGGAPEGHSH